MMCSVPYFTKLCEGSKDCREQQFLDVLEAVRIDFPTSIALRMFELMDDDGNGAIDFRELVCGWGWVLSKSR